MRGGPKVGAIRDRCEDARRPNRTRVSAYQSGCSEELQTPLPDKLSAGTVCFEVDGFSFNHRASMWLCSGSDFSTGGLYDHMSCRYGTAFAPRLSPLRCECVGERPRVAEILSMSEISPAMRRLAEYAKYVSSSRSFPARNPRRVLNGLSIEP